MPIYLLRSIFSPLPALNKIPPFLLLLGIFLGKIHTLHAQEPLKIFIYAGQSNAEGRAASFENIPPGTDDGNILFAWNIQAARNFLAVGWDTLQPVPRLNSSNYIHAGELAFARNLYAEGLEDIGVIKVTKAGTSLDIPWNPTGPRTSSMSGTGTGGMYWLMINFVEQKLADLDAMGIPYELEALVWHQGEGDTNPVRAPRYETNFQNFADSIKVHLSPDIELYAAKIYNPSADPANVALVQQALMTVATNNNHVHFVDLDSIYYDETGARNSEYITADGIHYKTPGYFKVGDALSHAYLQQNPVLLCDTLITQDAFSQISLNTQAVSDCGATDGAITLSGNLSGLVFSINGGLSFQDSAVFNDLPAGNYSLVIQDEQQLGCKVPFPNNPVLVAAPQTPTIDTVLATSPSLCGLTDGSLTINGSGNNLEYSLDNVSFQSTEQFIGLAAGVYRVYLRDNTLLGCVDSATVQVPASATCVPSECTNPNNLALAGVASQSTTRGNGEASFAIDGNVIGDDNWGADADMQHTETLPDSWWKVDLGDSFVIDSLSIYNRTNTQSYLLSRLSDFYIFFSEVDIDGNRATSALVNDPNISNTFFSGPAGSVEGFTYEELVGRYVMIKLTGPGPLHMAEVEIYGCESVPPTPCDITISEVNTMDRSDCEALDGNIEVVASGLNLEYSIDGGISFSPSPIFSGLDSGTYQVVVREIADPTCTTTYVGNPVIISLPVLPVINQVAISNTSGCGLADGSISITATGSGLEYSIDGGLYYQTSPEFNDLPKGQYEIFVRELGLLGCETFYTNNPVEIRDNSSLAINNVTFNDPTDCGLEDGSIDIQATGNSLEYSIDGGQNYQSSPNFSALGTGDYTIIVRESGPEGCEEVYTDNPLSIQAPTLPQIQAVNAQNLSDCGLLDGSLEISATGQNLVYSIDGGQNFSANSIFSGLSAGAYSIVVDVPGTNSCAVSYPTNPINIAGPSLPTILTVSPTDPSECGVLDGSISVSASGTDLLFSLDGVSFQSSNTFNGLSAGNYTVYVKEQGFNSCQVTGNTVLSEPEGCEACISANLALSGLASQSTTRGDGVASFAIDGNLIGDDNWGPDANMTHTDGLANSWWKVDLGEEASLDSVVIYNRTTTQAFLLSRLRDFYLFVSIGDIEGSRSVSDLSSDPNIATQFFSGDAGQKETINLSQIQGRYVLIKLPSAGPLHLAEVEVYGCEGPPPPCDIILSGVSQEDESDCQSGDGSISVQATGANLEYSVDGGSSFQVSPSFLSLNAGSYNVVVRKVGQPTCLATYVNNPVVISAPALPVITSILTTDLSDCEETDGTLTISAIGNDLEYSLDGQTFQLSPSFTGLADGIYSAYIREGQSPACQVIDQGIISKPQGCEPTTCSGSENVALFGTATQSTTRGNGVAGFAIDGNLIGNDNWGADANMQHTETQANSWWQVDLGKEVKIDSVTVYNRTTTQAFLLRRLQNFYVYISASEIDGDRSISELNSDPTITHQQFLGDAGEVETLIFPEIEGRYVLIKLPGSGPLHVAEVQVWGCSLGGTQQNTFREADTEIEESSSSNLLLYSVPNPFTQSFYLTIEGELPSGAYVQVVNSLGQILLRFPASQEQEINLEGKAAGVYAIQVVDQISLQGIKVIKLK